MKLGVSCPPEYWQLLKEIGYDYAEGYFAGVTLADEAAFRVLCEKRTNAGLNVEVLNGFFTGNAVLYGTDRKKTEADIAEYAEKGFFRAKTLGASVAVIGSGKARSIPADMAKEEAEDRFVSILSLLGDLAKQYDIQLAVEPLSHKETNLIGTVAEGNRFAVMSKRENVGTMIDFFHAFANGDPLDSLKIAKGKLFHAHIARPALDRKVPTQNERASCEEFALALKNIGYDERISLEAIFGEDMEKDLREAYAVMQLFRNH